MLQAYAAMMMTYQGLDLEAIDDMSIDRFLKLLPDLSKFESTGERISSEKAQEIHKKQTAREEL